MDSKDIQTGKLDLIPMRDCIKGRVYKLLCRNLSFGMYDGDGGFRGIRSKFGELYLFTEYHYDNGYGTVRAMLDTGIATSDVISDADLFKLLNGIEQNWSKRNE